MPIKIGKIKLIAILFLSTACVQTQNSSTSDKSHYQKISIDTSTPAGARLSAAYNVIKNNCVSCHSVMDIRSDAEWLTSGYISQGSATSSILYCRIKGSGCGAEDMPKDSSLSQSDLDAVKTWINNL